MAQVFGCGASFHLLENLINGIITQYSSVTHGSDGCHGMRIIQHTFKDCSVLNCGSNETFETLLRKAVVVDKNGHPAINVVIITDATDIADYGAAGASVETMMKKCFCTVSGSDDLAIVLLNTTEV